METRHHRRLTLDARIGHSTDLAAVKIFPTLTMKLLDKRYDMVRVNKVYEGIANIASILKVDRKVKEVISSFVFDVDFVEQHHLVILVGDVSNLLSECVGV